LNFVNSHQPIAVFISGNGSCLQSFLDCAEFQNIKLVVTNKKNTYGELKAKRSGVTVLFMTKMMSFTDLNLILNKYGIQKIFLAGFMKLIPAEFIDSWAGRIFNIHPSLLPDFKGLEAFEKSFAAKANMGATIHHVTAQLDSGEIILQKEFCQKNSSISFSDAQIQLRTTEQHLIREFVSQGVMLCQKF
jgi:phosphoribosylglycinamide formyltransferase 1